MLPSASVLPAKLPVRIFRPVPRVPAATAAALPGAWRYQAPKLSRGVYTLGLLLSVGVHALGLLAFNGQEKPAASIAPAPERIMQMEMPALPPEEPENQPEEIVEPAAAPAMPVPQLAEIPTAVPLNAMTQVVDFRPAVEVDTAGLRAMTIPVNIGRGQGTGQGLSNLFNLNDLDRIPEAIAQPAPTFPPTLKNQADSARVTVHFIVDSSGRVLDVRAVDSTHPGFEPAAINGVMRWKFKPGMKGGRKVATRMSVAIKFELTDSDL